MNNKRLRILGIRGVPAAHGGFETFAEYLVLYLVQRGWDVTVYCQQDGAGTVHEDTWEGIRRVHIPVTQRGPMGTIVFDWKSTLHAAKESGLLLTLGYNTAAFCALYRLKGLTNVINMDGIEWRRAKWSKPIQVWFWLNERLGCWLGNQLVADNPGIADHLATRVKRNKITMIPYGAEIIGGADIALLKPLDLAPEEYALVIARPEPENSILEIVSAFSRKRRGMKLVVLGNYEDAHLYQREVKQAASDEVIFPGAIYDKSVVGALRFFTKLYIHGHQVGGTNPSLVEALGAGNAVLSHGNHFNRWVAGDAQAYFEDEDSCALQLELLLHDEDRLKRMQQSSRERHHAKFTWEHILVEYEQLLNHAVAGTVPMNE